MDEARLCAAMITSGREDPDGPVVAVVSDRRLSLAALAALLQDGPLDRLLAVFRGTDEVRRGLGEYRPAVIIADGSWSAWPDYRAWEGRLLLVLDAEEDLRSFTQAVQCGPDGYLARSAPAAALMAAVEVLGEVGYYLDPLLEAHVRWAEDSLQRLPVEPRLSPRELEIIAAVASGRSTKEIARAYAVSAKTVCNHISHIYGKLEIRDRGQLVLYAAHEGLL